MITFPPKKKTLIVAAIALFLVAAFKIAVFDNEDFIFAVVPAFNEPSIPFYFCLNRIYRISEKKNISNKLIGYLKENKNHDLRELYIRTLGAIGDEQALYELKKLYVKYQKNRAYRPTISYVIQSIGMIGNESNVPFLETLLNKHDELNVQLQESEIAFALYLVTGKNDYYFTTSFGTRQVLVLYPELEQAREVIIASKNRKRNYKEMLIMDKLYHPYKVNGRILRDLKS